MKKRIEKKLMLNRETLRALSGRELGEVAGAATRFCSGGTSSCCTDTCVTCDCEPTNVLSCTC